MLSCTHSVRAVVALLFLFSALASSAVEVLTNNYNDHRTGANLNETILNVGNVKPESFGRLLSYAVDGPVFSQPLLAQDVAVARHAKRNVVYITTLNNSVYAFDADAQSGETALLWRVVLDKLPDARAAQINGILSTPVIDRASDALYVVASLMDSGEPKFVLHALDLADGSAKQHGPVVISGAVDVDTHRVAFQPTRTRVAVQRAALALAKDKLVIAFGGDYFEGWVFAYDKANLLTAPATFCTTCASRVREISGVDYLDKDCVLLGPGGGIWQAGRAPVVDEHGMVYFFTGNKQHAIRAGCRIAPSNNACALCSDPDGCVCKGSGAYKVCKGPDMCVAHASTDGGVFDTHDALIRLDPSQGLQLTGWFRPSNWDSAGVHGLETNDLDLGGSAPLRLPGTDRFIGGGKQGVMYVLDVATQARDCRASLSETCMPAEPLQSFQIAPIPPPPNQYFRHILGGPVLWTRSNQADDSRVFVWRQNDHLRSYALQTEFVGCNSTEPAPTTSHNCPPLAQSQDYIDHHPGGVLSLSANGDDAGSAIVWATTHRVPTGPGRLMAFKAIPDPATPGELTKLWDSENCAEDRIEAGSEFIPATVANGRVYVATSVNRVDVFGLTGKRECTPLPAPSMFGPMLQ